MSCVVYDRWPGTCYIVHAIYYIAYDAYRALPALSLFLLVVVRRISMYRLWLVLCTM